MISAAPAVGVIFALRLFKMAANQTECSGFEQRSVIKSLLAEKCKPSEIYRRMRDVFGGYVLVKISLHIG